MSLFPRHSRWAARQLAACLFLAFSACLLSCSEDASVAVADGSLGEADAGDLQCSVNEREPCYTGPEGTEGVGACRRGSRICLSELWSDCYQVVPTIDVCNQVDDDCNGIVDDGLQDACGRCEPVPGIAARCIGRDCLRGMPSTLGLSCVDACCDCLGLAPGYSTASFRQIFFLCDQEGLCAEGGESDRGWDQFLVDASLPPGTTLAMRFRAAAAKADLPSAAWHEASVDADDAASFRFWHSDAFSEYVEVEVSLAAAQGAMPEICQLLAIPIQYI